MTPMSRSYSFKAQLRHGRLLGARASSPRQSALSPLIQHIFDPFVQHGYWTSYVPSLRSRTGSGPESIAEVGAALDAVRSVPGISESSRLSFEFLVLTAARSGEALGAAWDEIDFAAREWRIPPERMKTGVAHAVPLGDAAVRTLETARELGGERFVFPSPVRRGSPLGESSLLHILRKTDLAARTTVHGFRSSFRSWAGECTDADHAVMELCLAHTVGNAVERAYARSDLMDKRRALMVAWAEAIGAA